MSSGQPLQRNWRDILGKKKPEPDLVMQQLLNSITPEGLDTPGCYLLEPGAGWGEWQACLLALLRAVPTPCTQYQGLMVDHLRDQLAGLLRQVDTFMEEQPPLD
jgi:hypothetical protein